MERSVSRQLCALVAPDRQPVQRIGTGEAAVDRPELDRKATCGVVGADIVQSQSDFAVLARVALTDDVADELKAVNAIQDRVTVMSLSHWIAAGQKEVKARGRAGHSG